jgi:hypothetical protein
MPAAKAKPTSQPKEAAPATIAPRNLVQLSIPTPDGDASKESMTAVQYAKSFAVTSSSDSAKAQEARIRLNTRIKALTEARMALTRPIDAAKKVIMDFFAGPIQAFTEAKETLDRKIIAYENEQEQLRRTEQRRLDQIAEAERQELQRKADEEKRKADAEAELLRKKAEKAAAAGRTAQAEKLQAQADHVVQASESSVADLEDRAAASVAPIVQADTARVAGAQFREVWEFQITDLSKINAPFLMADETKIGRVVQSLKKDAVGVVGEGLAVSSRKILATRRS